MTDLILWIIGILDFYIIPFLVINWCVSLIKDSKDTQEYFMNKLTKKGNLSTIETYVYEYLRDVNPEIGRITVTVDELIKYIKCGSIIPIFNIFLYIEMAFIVLIKAPKYKQTK